ncbi:hypothetical protein, partial [Rhodopirellula sallentina]|uniref:hypothetical protein n=1 Tax=Rhodopirellula sallentina TaxID=1263869 RepID=UPI001181C711
MFRQRNLGGQRFLVSLVAVGLTICVMLNVAYSQTAPVVDDSHYPDLSFADPLACESCDSLGCVDGECGCDSLVGGPDCYAAACDCGEPCLCGQGIGSRENASDWLRLDTPLTDALLDFQNRQTDKELLILENHARHRGNEPVVIVGGQARLSFLAATTNSEGKFPYLGRFPTDFSGSTATDARMLHANAHATVHLTSYASVYSELLFSDVFSFGDFKQGSLQVRQAYAVIGDFRVSPFYLYIGKKNVGFGDFSTLSPFTQSVTWHYFAALAEGIGGGYHDDRWDITLAGINGGRGIRLNDSPEQGKLNNMAANVTYTLGD